MNDVRNEQVCCACSSDGVAVVLDGAFRKPVCAQHRRFYAGRGYLIDALPPRLIRRAEVED